MGPCVQCAFGSPQTRDLLKLSSSGQELPSPTPFGYGGCGSGAAISYLFNYFVSSAKQWQGNGDAERLSCLQIDD